MPERYLSPAMHDEEALSLISTPLVGVEAKIYNEIWNAVIDTKLRPGAKLEETALCEIYGVSRTVIRKVLIIMEQEGIVALPLNRGAFVALPSPREAQELCEATMVLTAHAVTQLAKSASAITLEQRDKLVDHLTAETTAARCNDFHTARRLNMEYGIVLALIHGNRILAATLERHSARLTVALSRYQHAPAKTGGVEFTSNLNELILAGKDEAAVSEVRQLYAAILESMRFDQSDGTVDLKAILGSTVRAPSPLSN